MKTKRIIILEGADSSGKSSLCKHIQDKVNGKCHVLHSNYNKEISQQNHYRQHIMLSKFAKQNFDADYYTGNNVIVFDRSYVSDITYGQIGYGSKGTLKQKIKILKKLFKIITADPTVIVHFVYCNPDTTNFNPETKEELLTVEENQIMKNLYNTFCYHVVFQSLISKLGILFYEYNYYTDPDYKFFDIEFNDFN